MFGCATRLALAPQIYRRMWLPADPAGLVPLRRLPLPGPRREQQGRGGATALAVTIRFLIRCPLLQMCASLFPVQTTGRPTPPARYWFFYGALARELGSFEAADQEVLAHYELIREEFAAQGVKLPAAKPGTTNPVPGYHAFNRWRQDKFYDRFGDLRGVHRDATLTLAAAIRDAEARATGDPLSPSLGEVLSGDASVFQPPSDVQALTFSNEDTQEQYTIFQGSRAKNPKGARVHDPGGRYGDVKKHGPKEGFYHLAISTKGYDSYTRVVVDVDVAEAGQSESDAALPMLDAALAAAPGYFQAVAYDGQIYPRHALELLRRHGTYVVNHNGVKAKTHPHGVDGQAGLTVRQHGQYKDRAVRTHFAALPSQHHQRADGTVCTHHLVSDDGAVYPSDRPAGAGTPLKSGRVIVPAALRRHRRPRQGFEVALDYSIPCQHGDLTYSAALTETKPDSRGRVAWGSALSAHRVIPEAWTDRFREVFGARNQSESFFSWLEKCYFHKDRAASWGRQAQQCDLFMAALLHNAEAWAHYAYRHAPAPA
ncbi:hypothetical protein GCM10009657_09510 [Oryzihumus leptocrescens]